MSVTESINKSINQLMAFVPVMFKVSNFFNAAADFRYSRKSASLTGSLPFSHPL